MDPRIADYIRANRRKYTRDAITKQLIEAGHDRGEIERTWAALDTRDPDAVAGEGFWGRFALILIGINVGVLVLVGLLTGALQAAGQGGVILLVILAVVLAIGALIAWGIVAATGPAKMSPTTALVIGIVIPLLFALLIGGACYALIGGLGGGFAPPPTNGTMQVQLGSPLDLMEEMPATCQANEPDPNMGWSVFANIAYEDGSFLDVSVNVFSTGGTELQPSIYISMMSPSEPERPLAWANDAPGTEVRVSTDASSSAGEITFDALPAMQDDPSGDLGRPLSGEVTWTCE